LAWNLFNGLNTNRQIKNAKLNLNSTSLFLADTRARIEQELYVSYQRYQADREILNLEIQNVAVATENVFISMEAYRLGSVSGLALREAQDSFEEAYTRLLEARYLAKVSETNLMKLNGELVK
jgi:outer membrane protein TolC